VRSSADESTHGQVPAEPLYATSTLQQQTVDRSEPSKKIALGFPVGLGELPVSEKSGGWLVMRASVASQWNMQSAWLGLDPPPPDQEWMRRCVEPRIIVVDQTTGSVRLTAGYTRL